MYLWLYNLDDYQSARIITKLQVYENIESSTKQVVVRPYDVCYV